MKRFSERFYNPRPAPTPNARDEQYQQGQHTGHDDQQGPNPFQDGQQQYLEGDKHEVLASHHGSAHDHGSHAQHSDHSSQPMVESEVMAGGEEPDSPRSEQQHLEGQGPEPSQDAEKSQLRHISLANGLNRNRLPTLAEVLARRTLPPVDLYCYYLFLQREGSEDSLDFWLDVQQHENLCRAYFKDIRKSGRHVRDDWPGYYREARERGSIYTRVTGIELERDYGEKEEMERNGEGAESSNAHHGYGRASDGEWHLPAPGQPRFPGDPDYAGRQSSLDRAERRSNLFKRGSIAPTVLSRTTAITRTDLVASAERIYARYLLPGSEKEIYLPPQLRINSFPLSSSNAPDSDDEEQQQALARVPDMFHSQKE